MLCRLFFCSQRREQSKVSELKSDFTVLADNYQKLQEQLKMLKENTSDTNLLDNLQHFSFQLYQIKLKF